MTKTLYFITDVNPMSVRLASEDKSKEVGICLIQDAVYLGCKRKNSDGILEEAMQHGIQVFAARKDVEMRGLTKLIYPKVKILDYGETIDLVLSYERIINI
ncbi:MAG: DsrH/TusB family sulfur metabolism protein [Candidatus Bathyarchaeota archaeon]